MFPVHPALSPGAQQAGGSDPQVVVVEEVFDVVHQPLSPDTQGHRPPRHGRGAGNLIFNRGSMAPTDHSISVSYDRESRERRHDNPRSSARRQVHVHNPQERPQTLRSDWHDCYRCWRPARRSQDHFLSAPTAVAAATRSLTTSIGTPRFRAVASQSTFSASVSLGGAKMAGVAARYNRRRSVGAIR